MTPIQTKAQSLGIALTRTVSERLDCYYVSAKGVIDDINHFLKKHGLDDANVESEVENDYGDHVARVRISGSVPKTDAELEAEINRSNIEYTREKDRRYAEYLKLRAEFGGGNQ